MQIFVKSVTGKTVHLEVEGTAAVRTIKTAIADIDGVAVESQRLVAGGVTLEDERLIQDVLSAEATVDCNIDLLGGGKKRKKKVFATPKVIAHKHKTEKLATLKFYKVDDSGKIVKQRLECPDPICGVGVFMALHHNRHYCGKCGRYAPREGSE